MRSAQLLAELREKVPFEFDHRKAGKLVLLSSEIELDSAKSSSKLKKEHGCNTEILTREEAIAIEPAVHDMRGEILAAVYSEEDEVADAHKFTSELRKWLETQGSVEFRLSSTAKELLVRNDRVHSVAVDGDTMEGDAVVVCMGAWSQRLLRSVGVDPHVYPVRGYSITLPPGEEAPSVSVTALRHRMVFSRINGFIRIAGFADFTGFDSSGDQQRIDSLLTLARDYAPHAADYDNKDISVWAGLRPMTPNGRPRIGATGVDGLFVNTGHGMLGWTLACASGYDAAQAVTRIH
jgi:D-amino-acid dehydrogenase